MSGGIEEARRRLEVQGLLQSESIATPTPQSGEIPLPVVRPRIGRISDLEDSPRTPFDGRVLAWGISPGMWNDPHVLLEAGRDLETFRQIIAARLRSLGMIDDVTLFEFWTRESRRLNINVCSDLFLCLISF